MTDRQTAATTPVSSGPERARPVYAWLVIGAAWLLALAGSMLWLDARVVSWVAAHHMDGHGWRAVTWRWPGHFSFTVVLALVCAAVHKRQWRAGLFLLCCGIGGGLVYSIAKWVVGRQRPMRGDPPLAFHPLDNGPAGLFINKNLSFPSGHATLAFATAFAFGLLFPRLRWWGLGIASLVGLERVMEGAHYPSDILGAVAAGALAVLLLRPFGRAAGVLHCD